jgi:hypothetical protein
MTRIGTCIGARLAVLLLAAWVGAPAPVSAGATAPGTDTTEQTLATLDVQVESAVMLAHFIWQTSRFASFAEGVTALAPDIARTANGAAARYRSDIEAYLDLYSNLVLQMATGKARLNVSARIDHIEQDMSEQGLVQFQRFLPVLLKHVQQLQTGSTPSREQLRASILSVPSATTRAPR